MLRFRNWIIIIWNKILGSTWKNALCNNFGVLALVRSFAFSSKLTCEIHFDLRTNRRLLILIGTNYKGCTWCRRTHISADCLSWNSSTLASLELGFLWIQYYWGWQVLNHLNLFLCQSCLIHGVCIWLLTIINLLMSSWCCAFTCSWWGRSMLEKLFVHLLPDLTVFLRLNLFDLSVVNPIFVVHQILESIVSNDKIIIILPILTFLPLVLVLNLCSRWLGRWKIWMMGLVTSRLGETLSLCKALFLILFVLESVVAIWITDCWLWVQAISQIVIFWFEQLLLEFI